jgi:hypothetical protein
MLAKAKQSDEESLQLLLLTTNAELPHPKGS